MDRHLLISTLHAMYGDRDTTGFDAFDFVHAFGSGREALLYASLFWPEFAEFNKMVFLRSDIQTDEDKHRINEALKKYSYDVMRTERSFNAIEFSRLFGRRIAETTDDEDRLIAGFLREMWCCRLHALFPGRSFQVQILEPGNEGGELAILFFQTR